MSEDLSGRDAERVTWIGGARGTDEDGELVRSAIVDRHFERYGPLVRELAERLFARDNARVGGVADIGFFRSWYLVPARRLLERLEGVAIAVGDSRAARRTGRS